MSLYRRAGSPFYWSKLYAGGLVHRFSTRARTKVAALVKEREEAKRLARKYEAQSDRSIGTLAAQFLENSEAVNRAEATRDKMEQHLSTQIIPFLGAGADAATVTSRDLEEYKTRRMKEVSPQTVAKELSTIRQMFKYATETLKLFAPEDMPTTHNPTMPKYAPKWRLLSDAELARLADALAKRDRKARESLPYFLLMMNTGMRSGEVSKLQREWIDLPRREIHLPASVTKTRTARTVPLNESALSALLMVLKDGQVGRVFRARTHYTSWHRSVRDAGLATAPPEKKTSGVRPHDLRHSYGSLLYLRGTSTPEVRDILGHVTLMMANLYAHTFKERLHSAVNATNVGVPNAVPLQGRNVLENASKGKILAAPKKRVSATGK
jgi:integrase